MTELTIRPDEIRDALERFVSSYDPSQADEARSAGSSTPVTASLASRACTRP